MGGYHTETIDQRMRPLHSESIERLLGLDSVQRPCQLCSKIAGIIEGSVKFFYFDREILYVCKSDNLLH